MHQTMNNLQTQNVESRICLNMNWASKIVLCQEGGVVLKQKFSIH